MNFTEAFELLKTRRSIRKYTDEPPTRRQIEMIVEAACWAPSNHNRQGWKFIVFSNKLQIEKLAAEVRQSVRESVEVKTGLSSNSGKRHRPSCSLLCQSLGSASRAKNGLEVFSRWDRRQSLLGGHKSV